MLTGAFTGMVMALQGYYTLKQYGSEGALGSAVALSLIREMDPVLTGMMVSARAGSAVTAGIGIMRITEQLDALDTMAVNPIQYVVMPKLLAGVIAVPLLTAIFDVVGILGGYLVGVVLLGVSSGSYFPAWSGASCPWMSTAASSNPWYSASPSSWWPATRATTPNMGPRA